MRKYEFHQLDVFTSEPFAGNPLAVLPEAEGIGDVEMQMIAREMNLSETVFVLPSDKALKRLRIFTPKQELPLAGHPVVGTWNLLARLGVVEPVDEGIVTVEQELNLGILPVEVRFADSKPDVVTMTQSDFEIGSTSHDEETLSRIAESLGLERDEIAATSEMPVAAVSTGIGSLAVPLISLTALSRIKVNPLLLSEVYLEHGAVGCYAFTFETMEETSKIHARFFAPADSIPEDPATGSAAGSLSGYLRHFGLVDDGEFVIEQGDIMGRPSRINASVGGQKGAAGTVKIGGRSVVVAKGEVYLD